MVEPVENIIIKTISEELHAAYTEIDRAIVLSFKGFIKHNPAFLGEAVAIVKQCRENLKQITAKIDKPAKSAASGVDNVVLASPGYTDCILTNMDILIKAIGKKIDESVLFSEKAVNELQNLHTGIRGIIKDLADVVLTNNHNLASLLSEQANKVINQADTFATEHEERLVRGACSPKSSSIYLDMLESFRNIAWNAKQISQTVKK